MTLSSQVDLRKPLVEKNAAGYFELQRVVLSVSRAKRDREARFARVS